MFNELVELGEKGLLDADARIFRAKPLGIMYEDLLKVWFKDYTGYNILEKRWRSRLYCRLRNYR
jgi:hypothetical protein